MHVRLQALASTSLAGAQLHRPFALDPWPNKQYWNWVYAPIQILQSLIPRLRTYLAIRIRHTCDDGSDRAVARTHPHNAPPAHRPARYYPPEQKYLPVSIPALLPEQTSSSQGNDVVQSGRSRG